MKVLLDTNICIAAMRGHASAVSRLAAHVPGECVVSSVTAYELFTGVAKCKEPERERAKVARLLSVVQILSFDEAAAQRAATVRAELEASGIVCGPYDLLLAGHARALGLILATNNVREFSRSAALLSKTGSHEDGRAPFSARHARRLLRRQPRPAPPPPPGLHRPHLHRPPILRLHMPIEFTLDERLAGFVATSAKKGENVSVIFRELLGPDDPDLPNKLDQMHMCLFSKIPNLQGPPRIGDLIVIIDRELKCRAYVDELALIVHAIAARVLEKGQLVYKQDISGIESVSLGFEVSETEAVVIVRSFYWKRSLFFDFGPLHQDSGPRTYDLEKAMGQQMTLLMGLPVAEAEVRAGQSRLQVMKDALDALHALLEAHCDVEAKYQELLASAPWMLGMTYRAVIRHQKMDDVNIPDFTALRAYDECHDVVEMKQPFLKLFRSDGSFSASFNDTWNQAERYLDFCQRQRAYLRDQKQLRFENPRLILLIGQNLTAEQSDAIRAKESMSGLITVLSFDQLRQNARHVFDLVSRVEDRSYPGA